MSALRILSDTYSFYGCFYYFYLGSGKSTPTLSSCPYFRASPSDTPEQSRHKQYAKCHIYSLALIFYLWDKPHYRKGSYSDDLLDNLRNVAIPGTGIPLSIFARGKILALLLVLLFYPLVSIIAAVHHVKNEKTEENDVAREYSIRLLAPNDWFSLWRLNCRLVALHSLLHANPPGYEMENKWHFLVEGEKKNVPVSPFLKAPSGIVVKHKNEEGGMGIHFYHNASDGGDWIIQNRIQNSEWVSSLLPKRAPLSTFRVITSSTCCLDMETIATPDRSGIKALSCVFRAGREGAATDHDSILFDIDPATGVIGGGTTNAHWYRLGPHEILPGKCPWRSTHGTTHHPDGNIPVTGNTLPNIKGILELVEKGHLDLCPDVPLVGWDVVLSADSEVPICLLEVNLSCNFFRGSFDWGVYLDFVEKSFEKLHPLRVEAQNNGKKFK